MRKFFMWLFNIKEKPKEKPKEWKNPPIWPTSKYQSIDRKKRKESDLTTSIYSTSDDYMNPINPLYTNGDDSDTFTIGHHSTSDDSFSFGGGHSDGAGAGGSWDSSSDYSSSSSLDSSSYDNSSYDSSSSSD